MNEANNSHQSDIIMIRVTESAIPIVGCLALIVGSGLTIYIDRLERLRDETSPRPVLYRFFSQAILGMHQWPHWIFLMTCTIVGPCLFLTAAWQAALLEKQCPVIENCRFISWQLQLDGTATAICIFLDAWIPLGRPIITHISHTLVAFGSFLGATHYVYTTIQLARELEKYTDDGHGDDDEDSLSTIRTILFRTMLSAGVVIAVTMTPAIDAHGKLLNHQYRGTVESKMEPNEIQKCRRLEAGLCTAEMILGLGFGLGMFTAVPDVAKLLDHLNSGTDEEENYDLPYIGWGRLMFGMMLFLGLVQYWVRDPVYKRCQAMLLRFRIPAERHGCFESKHE